MILDPASELRHALALAFEGVRNDHHEQFVEELRSTRTLRELADHQVNDGDVAVYREAGRLRHAGKVQGRRIISKWGVRLLYEHEPHEVPSFYGEECAFYRHLTPRLAADTYRARLTARAERTQP
jgi:hypothetical protein